jgi:hypothetical protein
MLFAGYAGGCNVRLRVEATGVHVSVRGEIDHCDWRGGDREAWRGREEVTIRAQWDRRRACILEYLSDDMCGRGLAAAV